MIQRPGWSPFGRPEGRPDREPEPEPEEALEALEEPEPAVIQSDDPPQLGGEFIPASGGAVEQQTSPRPHSTLGLRDGYDELRDPNGPLATRKDPTGKWLPGTSGNPAGIWTPEHRPPQGTKPKVPYAQRELDWAIASRLSERLDAPEPEALDRLTLFARRMVDDALKGRSEAQKLLLTRLQPPEPREGDGKHGGGGIVVVTQVVGPQGVEIGAQTFDLPTGLEPDDED